MIESKSSKSGGSRDDHSTSQSHPIQSHFGIDYMKLIGESIGINNLSDEASRVLAEDVTFRVKLIIQEAFKFAGHSKRSRLIHQDIDNSLKIKNVEPLYGFSSSDHIPFRFASGGGRELYFVEDKEIDLGEVCLVKVMSTKIVSLIYLLLIRLSVLESYLNYLKMLHLKLTG